ncbi:MAG: hypothetical protein GY715_09290 [Planctomycetes bacterium]|nr:hypothetical protein [Planctomycetota bacterium]
MNAKLHALAATATASEWGTTPVTKVVPAPPPPTEDTCPADFDANGGVNFADLLWVINHWGPCNTLGPGVGCPCDLDADGQIGFTEFLEVMSNFNRACPDVIGGPSTEPATPLIALP